MHAVDVVCGGAVWLSSGVFFKHGERFRDLVGSPYYVAPEVCCSRSIWHVSQAVLLRVLEPILLLQPGCRCLS